jgi:hypothetical protein
MNTQEAYQHPPQIDMRPGRRLEAMSTAELVDVLRHCGDAITDNCTWIQLWPDVSPWPIKTAVAAARFQIARREYQGVK